MSKKLIFSLVIFFPLISYSQDSKSPHSNLSNELFEKGVSMVVKGDLKNAIKTFKDIIDLDPKYAEAHRQLGIVYTELKDIEKAINSFNDLIKLKPKEEDAYWLLA